MLQFSEFVWALSYSVWDVLNNVLLKITAWDLSITVGTELLCILKKSLKRILGLELFYNFNYIFHRDERIRFFSKTCFDIF